MLYQLHEMQRSFLTPLMQWADASSKLFSNPVSPLAHTPFAQRIAAGYELMYRLGKEYHKPAFAIESTLIDGQPVGIMERTIVTKPFCKLLHFKKDMSDRAFEGLKQPKVLLVAPLSGHHATLLRDTVRGLLPQHDVYITDWTDARMVPLSHGPFHLDDYIYYVQDFIRLLGPDVHVISVCQPTVPVLAAISLMATNKDPLLPKTMTMMGGPIDPRKSPTAVNDLAIEKPYSWFENTVIYAVPGNYPGFGRKVYPGFLQHAGFIAMNPGRHAQSHREFYQHLVRGDDDSAEGHRQFYDEYNAVLDMPAEYYLDTIKTVFQEFRLPLGTWQVGGQLVRPQDIKTVALFTVEGELDDISGAGQT
jgi:poly(3-hydroxybutyrate) depolymerase